MGQSFSEFPKVPSFAPSLRSDTIPTGDVIKHYKVNLLACAGKAFNFYLSFKSFEVKVFVVVRLST